MAAKVLKKELISLKVFAAVAVMVAHRLEILRPGLQAAALGLDVERAPDGRAKLLPRDRPGRRRGGLRRVPSGEGQAGRNGPAYRPTWPWIGFALLGIARDVRRGEQCAGGEQPAVDGGFVPQTSSTQARPLAAGAALSTTSPREEFRITAPGFIRAKRASPAMRRVVSSSGVWNVRMSAWRATSSSGRKPQCSRASRGGSQQRTRKPHVSAYPLYERSDVSHADDAQRTPGGLPASCGRGGPAPPPPIEYALALQPAAVQTGCRAPRTTPCRCGRKPMVAVAIRRTREPPSSRSSQRVRVRIRRASASRTSSGAISPPEDNAPRPTVRGPLQEGYGAVGDDFHG